ncbi:hypothetical protein COCC4DRAFT_147408 [Bipolaris maydis ATCC 48331]|uniref:Uncharacterized protein n=2 Tax=Cochliobolus heterostrophus TaxID=5016 RepID=M2TAS4_COCH5|nr:uncharacterized protein COCC4DRAFT_147408 [Bipolaris maydis ATCC 48331]EMD94670.1 hypothetical protein COCHEDRAFT_1090756 [Bipolaris maydis C5]ENI01618.1 hypothetical protein COCC4DRAFT_147408 [Bipolaris maydis ATCC 48331]
MPPNSPQVEPEPHESINAISTIDSYNLLVIALCSSTCNPHSLALPMLFHLLTCGHIVTIDHPDQRCARNCHHTLSTPLPPSPSAFQEPQYTYVSSFLATQQLDLIDHSDDKITLIAGGTEAHTDTLYCEVCTGIPFDKYYTMLPPTSTSFPRRCLALSRAIIAAATMLPAPAVEELLCPVLYVPGRVPHELKCGHRVWCVPERRCGVNCRDMGWKGVDGVVCAECVGRGERVYRRYWGVAVK